MARESLGYVELEWTCPSCGRRNPGRAKVCAYCGAPQPEDVAFEQAAEEKLVKDTGTLESLKAGPDIHCPFCGTRNVATPKPAPVVAATCAKGCAEKPVRCWAPIVTSPRLMLFASIVVLLTQPPAGFAPTAVQP